MLSVKHDSRPSQLVKNNTGSKPESCRPELIRETATRRNSNLRSKERQLKDIKRSGADNFLEENGGWNLMMLSVG